MIAHTRAMVAAAAYAFITAKKVAGLFDHSTGQHLRIAAEAQGDHLQGYDGDRSVRFGGTLPELYDAGDKAFVSMTVERLTAQGHDRGSASAYAANVTEPIVQLYDYAAGAWFAFSIQTA